MCFVIVFDLEIVLCELYNVPINYREYFCNKSAGME